MKKKIIVSIIIVIILGIASAYFYTTLSPHNHNVNNYYAENTSNNTENFTTNVINNLNSEDLTSNTMNNLKNTDLFSEYYDKAQDLLDNMTLEEKVGQIFLARFPSSGVIDEILKYNPAGYILFGKDFKGETPNSIKEKLQNCQGSSKIPLAFGVDEEGGTVVRVSAYKAFRSSPFKSPRDTFNEGGMEKIISDSHEKSNLLKNLGINMNLSPVVDVPESPNDFIYSRSFSTDVNEVKDYTKEIINSMNEDNITSVMKHFPGYGNNVDTHTGISIDNRNYSTFENRDFIPFEEGIKNNCPAILVSHNVVKCMDSSKPASLSKNVHDILRNKLNFSGIIITDDLAMYAVKEYVDNGEAATQAVLAGNDLIISSDFVNQRNEVLNSVKNGTISENTINTAVKRVLSWKLAYGIIK